ncbi:MAG: flagellar basal body protein [Deltaproteobacteria bacterium]|nr:flagellar basal body protein [Deltaproteobacteria bacterium]
MQIGSANASALSAFGVDMLVRANNIANVNTPGFHARNLSLMTGNRDQGVMVGLIDTDKTPGPPVPGLVPVNQDGREALAPGYLEGSNTDIAREYVHMIGTQRAYEANALAVRTVDDMTGMLLDMKI